MSERKNLSRVVVKNNRDMFSERELEQIESLRAVEDANRKVANIDEMLAAEDL